MKQKIVWCCFLLFLFPYIANAQSITSSVLTITPVGGTALTPTIIPFASTGVNGFVCNQTPPTLPPGAVLNPGRIIVDDPNNTGMVCIYTDPGNGPLKTLPFGATQYTATLMWTDSTGNSVPSIPSQPPFSVPGLVPGVPTGLKVIQ